MAESIAPLPPPPAAGEPPELLTLRRQLLALAQAESEARDQAAAARAELRKLVEREANARSQLREAQGLTRLLQERLRLEGEQVRSGLKEHLEAEKQARAAAEVALSEATGKLRELRHQPTAEMETLRALFADLMRNEAHGRQRLVRLQQQVEGHERSAQELSGELARERAARAVAEARAVELEAARPADPGQAAAGPALVEAQARAQELDAQLAAAEEQRAALAQELAELRGRALVQAERAAAELEWAQDRARAATHAEQEAKDEAHALRRQVGLAKEKLEQEYGTHEQQLAQRLAQQAELRRKLEDERQRSAAELARREAALEGARKEAAEARDELAQSRQRAREQTELAGLHRDEVIDLQRAQERLTPRLLQLERERAAADAHARRAHDGEEAAALEREALREALRTERATAAEALGRAAMELAQVKESGAQELLRVREAAAEEKAQVKAALERAAAEGEEGRATLARTQTQLHDARARASTAEMAQRSTREELSALQPQHARLQVELAAKAAALEAAQAREQQAAQALAALGAERDLLLRSKEALAAASAGKDGVHAGLAEQLAAAREASTVLVQARETALAAAWRDREQIAARLEGELARARERSAALEAAGQRAQREAEELAVQLRDTAAGARAAQSLLQGELDGLRTIESALTPRRRAVLAAADGRFAEAEALLQGELSRRPNDASLHLALGRLHLEAPGEREARDVAAEAAFARAAELEPAKAGALLLLARVRRRRGLRGPARAALREALRREPGAVEAREGLLLMTSPLAVRALAAALVLAVVSLVAVASR